MAGAHPVPEGPEPRARPVETHQAPGHRGWLRWQLKSVGRSVCCSHLAGGTNHTNMHTKVPAW